MLIKIIDFILSFFKKKKKKKKMIYIQCGRNYLTKFQKNLVKIKLHTKSHPIELLKKYTNNNEIFTAEEHAKIIEESSGEIFKSKNKCSIG